MDDERLEAALSVFHSEGFTHPESANLRDSVMHIPDTGPGRDGFLASVTSWSLGSAFRPLSFVVAGAIVAVFGAFLLTGLLATPQDEGPAPAATSAALEDGSDVALTLPRTAIGLDPWNTRDLIGTVPSFTTAAEGQMSLHQNGFVVAGEAFEGTLSGLADPRLNGTVRHVINRSNFLTEGEAISYVTRIDNDGGSWLGSGYGYNVAEDPTHVVVDGKAVMGLAIPYVSSFDTTVFRGSGDYEGLSAILVSIPTAEGIRVSGAVFSGEFPALPEMPAADE